ncbi:MAG: DUF4143 domain-containing protein [Mangrovibacterium sp.]
MFYRIFSPCFIGNEFESLVIAEIYKQVQTSLAPVPFFHLRTQDGREIDLLLELSAGYLAFEIKMTETVRKQDAKHLLKLEQFLDKPLLHAIVRSRNVESHSLLKIRKKYLINLDYALEGKYLQTLYNPK